MIIHRAITTKYLGPTNANGSRVKATAFKGAGGSFVHHWEYGIANDQKGVSDVAGNHVAAARELARRLSWDGEWVMGGLPNEEGFAFVLVAPAYSGKLIEHSEALAFTVGGDDAT